ncbi:hypothetical protein GCM10027615_04030 [Plantactinospora veratri]
MTAGDSLPIADPAQVRRYARGLVRRHPRALAGALGLHALAAITGLAAPRLLGDLVEAISQGTSTVTVDRIALAIAGFVLAQAVLVRFAHFASARLGERVLAELREEFVDRILAIPLSTVERAGTGDLLTRSSRDVAALSRSVRFAVPETLIAVVTVCAVVGAVLLTDPLLILPALVAAPILVPATRWYLRRAGPGYLAENAAYSDITDGISETVEGPGPPRRSGSGPGAGPVPTPTSAGRTRPSATPSSCVPSSFRWPRPATWCRWSRPWCSAAGSTSRAG